MFVFLLCLSLMATSFAAPADPLVGGFRPVPPSIGGPIGVAPPAGSATNNRASRPIWEGGNDVKPWLASQPRLHPN